MTTQDQQEFKKLIIDGVLEVFRSKEGKGAIKESAIAALKSQDGQSAVVNAMRSPGGQSAITDAMRSPVGQSAITDAMRSPGGQEAMVDAINSKDGQEAIKKGSLAALKSEEGKEILIDNFVEGFHEAVVPILGDHGTRIKRIERKIGIVAI